MKRLMFLAVFATACGGEERVEDPKPIETQTVVQAATPSLEGSKCLGNRVPPTNYNQETAFVSVETPDAAEVAKQRAVASLRDRICQGYRCTELEPRITLWNTQQDAVQVCAMAVISGADIDAFVAAPRASFDADLLVAAKDIEATLKAAKKTKVAFDNVRDLGVDGGLRAEWLLDRMSAALSKTDVALVRPPRGWDGLDVPKGADAVLRGRVTRLQGRESILEVTWNLDLGTQLKTVTPVAFPEMIGPHVETTELGELPDLNQKVSLRFDSRPGGALCNGQTTEMKLATTEPLHARVVDLFGKDEALLIWASEGTTKPGKAASLGEFMAVHQPGTTAAERFLVVAARKESDLGQYAAAPVPCRIPKDDARKLHYGEGLPDATKPFATSRSYRIMEGGECSQFATPPTTSLDGLPMCW